MREFRKLRRFKQEISKDECINILKNSPRGIMAFNGENGYPYAIPLNQLYRDGKIYFHCGKEGLKLDLIKENNNVCFTVLDNGFKKDGEWSLNISSVVCLGKLIVLEENIEKENILLELGKKFYPGIKEVKEEIRKHSNNTTILVMEIDRLSGKLVNES